MYSGDKISFGELKKELKAQIWPNGVPENLDTSPEGKPGPIDVAFEDAFIDIQGYVSCLQDWHTDVYKQCSTYFQCGLTVIEKPRGILRRVRTFQGELCDPVTISPTTFQHLKCYSRRFMERVTAPANKGMPALPGGFRFADATTDSQYGRALAGYYAIERDKLYIAPWIQSTESIVIEWDGLKKKFKDEDLLPDERDLKRAMKLFVQSEFSRDFERDFTSKKQFKVDYEEARAELMWDCANESRTPQPEVCTAERAYLWDHHLEDDATDTTTVKKTVIALVGDYGAGEKAVDVASLIKSWTPNAIVTLGDNRYTDVVDLSNDEEIGSLYRAFMFPYNGIQPLWSGETAVTKNAFWPCLGNHDIDFLAEYIDYFKDLTPGNDRYYDVVIGPVHFFVINDGLDTNGVNQEPFGSDALSMQAAWFRDRVATSLSRWKVAVVHHPPYSSYRYPGTTSLRWIKGVDLVISGHNHHYERLDISGQKYVIAGTGGRDLYSFDDTVLAGSVIRYDEKNGALRMTATCSGLLLEFINVDGEVIDAVALGDALDSDGSGGTGGVTPPPDVPSMPPATFELIHFGSADPRSPLIVPGDASWPGGDPDAWGIYLQEINGIVVNTFYWNPNTEDYQ